MASSEVSSCHPIRQIMIPPASWTMGIEMPNSLRIQLPARVETVQMTKQYKATFLAALFLSGKFRPERRGSTINADPTGFTAGKSEKNPTNTSCKKGKLNDISVR